MLYHLNNIKYVYSTIYICITITKTFATENNSFDNADGAGVTLRTADNPSNSGGSIFAVRSEADASRLWVGQDITTPGDNEFHCGYTGEPGGEASASNYAHKLTDSIARFGTPVQCDYDLTVDGTVTCSALYGGAATQIDNAIAAAATQKAKFTAYASAVSATYDNTTFVTVPYDTISYTTGASDFELAGGVLTVKRSMLALISYHASINMDTGTDRNVSRLDLKRAALGSGFVTVNGASSYLYNRTVSEGEGSGSVSQILEFAADDQLLVEALKEAPSTSTLRTIANACSITILEL